MTRRRRKERRGFNGLRASFEQSLRHDCQNSAEFSSVSAPPPEQSQLGGNRLPARRRAASLSPPSGKRAVTGTIEAQKAGLIRDAQKLAGRQAETAERAALRRFVAALYQHVPPSDVAARSPADLCGAAIALWRF